MIIDEGEELVSCVERVETTMSSEGRFEVTKGVLVDEIEFNKNGYKKVGGGEEKEGVGEEEKERRGGEGKERRRVAQ